MVNRILISIVIGMTMLLLAGFIVFCNVRYLKDQNDKPERILMYILSSFCITMGAICIYGIMTC